MNTLKTTLGALALSLVTSTAYSANYIKLGDIQGESNPQQPASLDSQSAENPQQCVGDTYPNPNNAKSDCCKNAQGQEICTRGVGLSTRGFASSRLNGLTPKLSGYASQGISTNNAE